MIVPIVKIPASIADGLSIYRGLFPRRETYDHIQQYCTGLVVLEKPSIKRATALTGFPSVTTTVRHLTLHLRQRLSNPLPLFSATKRRPAGYSVVQSAAGAMAKSV
ncbi:MAG: hypothetical protein O7E52_12165, partial [Candidatus Poribacteria bacterium]|nr:hypothetical protein [Candidatus Poribacteria bacterium]